MKHCPECGKDVGQTANYCKGCGRELRADDEGESKNTEPKQELRSQGKNKKTVDYPYVESIPVDTSQDQINWAEISPYLLWGWGGLLILIAGIAIFDRSLRGIAAGLFALCLSLVFIPVTNKRLMIDSPPGIENTNSSRRNVLVGAGYGLLSLIAVGAAMPNQPDINRSPNEYPEAWGYDRSTGLVLYNVEARVSSVSTEITGEIENVSGVDYQYVSVTFSIYDSEGTKVGDALDNTSGLEDGGRWRFEALSTQTDGVERFKLDSTSAN